MDKYIFRKKRALTDLHCNILIKYYEDRNIQHNEEFYEDDIREYSALSTTLNRDKFLSLWDILEVNIREYASLHKFLKSGYEWKLRSYFNIQKYEPGRCYKMEHCEHSPEYSQRILGWMVYLNNIKKGGGTCWPQQNFKSKPRIGDLYIWPAAWTHSHYGIVAPHENKYILTGWCNWLN